MKKTLTKLLVCTLIMLILTNYCMTNIAHANAMEVFTTIANGAWGVVVEFIEDILGTVVGIFAIIPKVIVLPLALSAQSFMATIAYSQGTSDADGNIKNATILNTDTWFLTPFDIIFNKVALVDVNIFNIPNTPGAIKSIREAAAGWYYVMRNIAAAILLCVLIYVGIRMSLSTVASDKAAYKKMLVDWIASLALIFILQYIIVFTFAINTAFIKALESVSKSEGISSAILKLYASALWVDIDSIAATIVICMLTWQTMSLLISYISRMLKVTFLVIISPLITLTYSIDKMGDGKAQALNTWLKEFIYTVLLQPFHCIIYTAFIGIAMSILSGQKLVGPFMQYDNNNVGAAVLCILCIHFVKEAEKILGKIFNFADSTSGASLATGMMATAAIASNAKNIGKGARSVVNTAKNAKSFLSDAKTTLAVAHGIRTGKAIQAADQPVQERNDSGGGNNTQQQEPPKPKKGFKAKAGAAQNAQEGNSIPSVTKREQKALAKEAERIMKNEGLSKEDAEAKAKEKIDKKKKEKQERKENIKAAKTFFKESETAKMLKNEVIPSIISTGAGIFVGAGSFGVGGNAIQSVMLGTATSKGTGEFFKTSSNRLAIENAQLLEGAGKTTVKDAQEYIGAIAGREDEFKEAEKNLGKLYDEILSGLQGLSDKEKNQVKGSIRNIVSNSLLKNPTANNAAIMDEIKNNGIVQDAISKSNAKNIEAGKEPVTFDTIAGSVSATIDFQRDAKIYENMANVRDWGLKPEVMMDDTIKHFRPSESPSSENDTTVQGNNPSDPPSQNSPENSTTTQTMPRNEEVNEVIVEEMTSDLSPEVVEQLEKNVNEELTAKIEEIRDTYEKALGEDNKHADAARMALEQHLETVAQENQSLVKQLLESEVFMTKLKEENYSLQGVIKKLRRVRGGE